MHFIVALLGLLQLTVALIPRAAAPAPTGVCTKGVYAKLAPLAYYSPAQKFCSKKYPNTVTVTKDGYVQKRSTTTTTTTSTTTTSTTTSVPAKCTKDALECLYSSVKGDGAKTFCSCYGPTKTVTVKPSPTPVPTCASAPIVVNGQCGNDNICIGFTTCEIKPNEAACQDSCAKDVEPKCTGSSFDPETGECIKRPDCCPKV